MRHLPPSAWLALLFILSLNQRVVAQEIGPRVSISGRVVDGETLRPLPGATVGLFKGDSLLGGSATDDGGRYHVRSHITGQAAIIVRYVGYEAHVSPLTAARDTTLHVDVRLAREPVELAAIEIIGGGPGAYRAVPGAASRLDAREIELLSPIGTQELLQHVPGINGFADDGIGNSRISIGIRGLNPRRSSRVLVLEDGIPIQPAIYVYPNMYYNPPVERIDRVEVIKGSAAVRYGPQTMGGVINYITSRPRTSFGASANLTTGTNGFTSVFGEVGGFGTERIKPELQMLFKRGDGFRENNQFHQYNGTLKLNILPDPDRVLYLKANANYENSNATYTGLTEYSFKSDPAFNPKDDDLFRVFRSSLDLIYDRTIGADISSTTRAYLNYFDRRWWREKDVFVSASTFDPSAGGQIDPVPWYATGDLIRIGNGAENLGILRTFYTGGVEHNYELNHRLYGASAGLEVGARLHWERFVDDKKVGSAPNARSGFYFFGDPEDLDSLEIVGQSNHYETAALALYAQEELTFGDLRLVPGMRAEVFEQSRIDRLRDSQYRDKTSYVLLPGLGFNYAVGQHNFFGGIHRGYTPPSSGTLGITSFGQHAGSGGLDLKAEKSWNSELGARGALHWLAFEAVGFHLHIQDLVAAGRGTAFKNLGKVQTYGVEWASTVHASVLSQWLPDLNLTYTYLETSVLSGRINSALRAGNVEVDITGNELPYAPRHSLTVGLQKSVRDRLSVRTDLQYVSRVFTDFENVSTTSNRGDTGPIPAHAVLNASARYRIGQSLDVLLSVKNLLNERYVGSRLHSNPGQPEAHLSSGILPGAPRQVNLGLRYNY